MYSTISRGRIFVYRDWFIKSGNSKPSRLNEFMAGFFRGTGAPGRQHAACIDHSFMDNPGKSAFAKAAIRYSSFLRLFRMSHGIVQNIIILDFV